MRLERRGGAVGVSAGDRVDDRLVLVGDPVAVGDAAAASWDWLSNPPPDTAPRGESGGDGGVILLGALGRDDEVDNLAGGRDDLEDVHMELAE